MQTQPPSGLSPVNLDAHIIHADALPPSSMNSTLRLFARIILFIALRLLLEAFSIFQSVSYAIHERLCRFFALPPCQVHGPRESAIVIVGGDDGEFIRLGAIGQHAHKQPGGLPICLTALGRHIAFDCSEQGYTVFALCPDRHPAIEAAPDASNVSSVRAIHSALFPAPLMPRSASSYRNGTNESSGRATRLLPGAWLPPSCWT